LKTSLRRALWGAIAVAVVVAAVPAVRAAAAGTVTATFSADSDWGSGHQARVTITNGTTSAVATWSMTFTLPAGATIGSSWDTDITRTGTTYVAVKKSWAGPLAAGAVTTFGYIGTGAYRAPTACTINGAACAAGSQPPATTPPVTTPPVTNPPTTPPVTNPPVTNPPTSSPPTSTPPTSTPPTTTPPTGGPPVVGGGPLGPNVRVFDPSMSTASIQSQLTTIFNQQESNQFGSQRYELLFKPGTYNGLSADIGFYTSIAGLGKNPTDVQFNGDVTVDAQWFQGNATQNFWRSAENFTVNPPTNAYMRWAVAQAAPFRRMNIGTNLSLTPTNFGWASGGYIADSKINGQQQEFSQQQWFTRNSSITGSHNAVWNMVFSGVQGAPPTTFPNPPVTTIAQTPISREKPYLYLNGADYEVFVPSLQTNSSGVSWPNTPGTSIPLTRFFVAKPGDSAATINSALSQGLNLLFTPGIYHVNQTINVTRANTVVLGLGYATIIPDNGVTPMAVADVDGVKVASLLFDAGTTNSANLLTIGGAAKTAVSHAANPTSIQDVFFRIGGAGPGSATNSLLINSNNTLIDHIWAWRADHGEGVSWTANPAASGLIVNGDNVLALALFVEHYQKYQVQWNGNGGRTIFFQNEIPYDVPDQATWRSGANGYAAYKVADSVTTHEAWGLGSYCFFNVNPTNKLDRGFEIPIKPGIKMHNLLTVSLGGQGSITNVINTTGGVAQGVETIPSYVTSFP
jgi:hypothetical protein